MTDTRPEAYLKLTWDHKFTHTASKRRFKSRHRPIICTQCNYPFRGRGTFGLENSSGVTDKEQPIFSLPHRLEGQGPDPSPHDNSAKSRQAPTNKDHTAGDGEIFIRPWMPFRACDEGSYRAQREMATRTIEPDNSGLLPTPEDPLG